MTTFGKMMSRTLMIILIFCVIGCDEKSDTHNDESVSTLTTRTTDLENRTTAVETRTTDVEARATSLETRATDVEARATSLETRTTAVEGNVSALQAEVDGKLNINGGTLTGNLTVPSIVYSTPRIHRVCISGDMFRPRTSGDDYYSGYGMGGTRVTTAASTTLLMAEAHIPDGAVITGITYHVYDTDASNNLQCYTYVQNFAGGYENLHTAVTSTGSNVATQALSVVPATNATVNNALRAIQVRVLPAGGSVWTANLYIRGVSFTYTLNEAP